MTTLRNIFAVISGYAIFVISALLLFQVSGHNPHADPSFGFIVITIVYGLAFSYMGGLVTQIISKSRKLYVNYFLAALMVGFATFSLFKTTGNHYSQLAAIFLFAPASMLASWIYLRNVKGK